MFLTEYLHFRVHTETIDLSDFVEFLQTETDLLMIVKEFGKCHKEHIHATLKLKTAKSTFIDRLKKKFPSICGNKSYGMTFVRDFDKNARYTYKGTPADYPDILYTKHTEAQWKDYYKRYWEEFDTLHKVVNTGCQNGSTLMEPKTKTKAKPFNLKLAEELWEDHKPLFGSIWYYHALKQGVTLEQYTPINTLEDNQDYLANILYKKLGQSAKNIDDFIMERMYCGLYAYILQKCPYDLTTAKSKNYLDKFRHKL